MAEKKAHFITPELDTRLKEGSDIIRILNTPLGYWSPKYGEIWLPAGFESDGASVPRVPIAYWLYGGRAHREGFLHDFAFRKDSFPLFSFMEANQLFLEAMESRGKNVAIRYPMYWGVCIGSYLYYHKRSVFDRL